MAQDYLGSRQDPSVKAKVVSSGDSISCVLDLDEPKRLQYEGVFFVVAILPASKSGSCSIMWMSTLVVAVISSA